MRHALLLAFTVLAAALPHRVEAQAISTNATISINGAKALKNGSNVYINNAQCNSDNWTFELQGYSNLVPFLELWVTNNSSTDCTQMASRTSANNTQPICWQVPIGGSEEVLYLNSVRTKVKITVPGRWIFNSDRNRDNACDPGIAGSPYKLQFVTLASPTTVNTTTVPDNNRNANQISAILTLYSKIPVAPAGASTINGGRTIGIKYDKIDNDPLTEYRAYFYHDPAAIPMPRDMDGGVAMDGGSGTCNVGSFGDVTGAIEEETLADGGVIETPSDSTRRPTGSELAQMVEDGVIFQSGKTKGEKLSIDDLDRKDIPFDTYTAASVFAIDGAGNLGYLSSPVCVQRVQTIGYLEYCKDAGVDCGELDSCSLSPRNSGSAFWLSACTLALSAWLRRRRRSN